MKALVTGGAGFLGSHVTDRLAEEGWEVRVFDRIESDCLPEGAAMQVGDLLDTKAIAEAMDRIDAVFHFAGMADLEACEAEPVEAVRNNILGTTLLLDAARRAGVGRFLFASSIYVYSHLGSFYRSTKQACEKLIQDYQQTYGLDFTILRFGSIYGPRAGLANAVRRFVEQAIREGKIIRFGNGEEIREYIHVKDAAAGAVEAANPEHKNHFVMLTGNQSMIVRDLLDMIREMMEGQVDIEYRPGKESMHYRVTPFSFRPEPAKKLSLSSYHDLGEGILDLVYEMFQRIEGEGGSPISLRPKNR